MTTPRVYKPIPVTLLPDNGSLSIQPTCVLQNVQTCSANSKSVETSRTRFNDNYLIPEYAIIPNLDLVATPDEVGALWKNNIYVGMGLSTDPLPDTPVYFGGKKIGQIYNSLIDINDDVFYTDSKFYILKDGSNYFGVFVAFKEYEDSLHDGVFWKYKAPPGSDRTYKSSINDVNKLTILFTKIIDGKVDTLGTSVVLKNKGYKNSSPTKFPILFVNSEINTYVTSNPPKYYNLLYQTKVNLYIDSCQTFLKGNSVTATDIVFKLKKVVNDNGDTIDCEDFFPQNLKFQYNLYRNPDFESAKLKAYYLITNHETPNFIDGFAEGVETTFYRGSYEENSNIIFNSITNTLDFSTELLKSLMPFDSSNYRTTDNTLEISFDVEY